MADGDGSSSNKKNKKPSKSISNNESERKSQVVKLDLVDDNLRKHDNYRLGNQNTGAGNFKYPLLNSCLIKLNFTLSKLRDKFRGLF